jgi:hypothetical protein
MMIIRDSTIESFVLPDILELGQQFEVFGSKVFMKRNREREVQIGIGKTRAIKIVTSLLSSHNLIGTPQPPSVKIVSFCELFYFLSPWP